MGRPLDDPETKFFPSRFFMDSSQSQQEGGPYAGFTCTDIRSESDGVIIEVNYDKCKKVAFAEDPDVKLSEAIVNYPLYKLYDIFGKRIEIKLTSNDYVFITWLQPIPPTFHTINQVAYIVSIATKLQEKKIPHVLVPYMYFYHEIGLEKVYECFYRLAKETPGPNPKDLLGDLVKLTENQPIHPSLILLETTPSVIGWFDHVISVNLSPDASNAMEDVNYKLFNLDDASNAIEGVNYKLFNLDLARKWIKHTFTPQDFVKIVEERMKLPGDIKEGVQKEITNIYDTIPDALPLAVAYSILFPLQFLQTLRNVAILLFGMTPRDIIYYLAVEKALNSESKDLPKVFYIPTRSIIHDYVNFINKISSLNNEVGIVNCFKNPFIPQHGGSDNKSIAETKKTDKISVALLLLFHKSTQEFICVKAPEINECKIIDKASKIYEEIKKSLKSKTSSNSAQVRHAPQCCSINSFSLLYEGQCKTDKCIGEPGWMVLAMYSSVSRETVNTYIIYYRSKRPGQSTKSIPVIRKKEGLASNERRMGVKSIDLRYVNLPIPTWYKTQDFIKYIHDKQPPYVKFAFFQGKIRSESSLKMFWLTNVLYFFILEK